MCSCGHAKYTLVRDSGEKCDGKAGDVSVTTAAKARVAGSYLYTVVVLEPLDRKHHVVAGVRVERRYTAVDQPMSRRTLRTCPAANCSSKKRRNTCRAQARKSTDHPRLTHVFTGQCPLCPVVQQARCPHLRARRVDRCREVMKVGGLRIGQKAILDDSEGMQTVL